MLLCNGAWVTGLFTVRIMDLEQFRNWLICSINRLAQSIIGHGLLVNFLENCSHILLPKVNSFHIDMKCCRIPTIRRLLPMPKKKIISIGLNGQHTVMVMVRYGLYPV